MRLNEITFDTGLPVDGYGPGFFRVAGALHEGGLLLLPSGLSAWAGWADIESPAAEAASIDVLFVGTGADVAFPPPNFVSAMEAAGVAVEAMATAPACRTYNVLLSEGRRVGLAALPV